MRVLTRPYRSPPSSPFSMPPPRRPPSVTPTLPTWPSSPPTLPLHSFRGSRSTAHRTSTKPPCTAAPRGAFPVQSSRRVSTPPVPIILALEHTSAASRVSPNLAVRFLFEGRHPRRPAPSTCSPRASSTRPSPVATRRNERRLPRSETSCVAAASPAVNAEPRRARRGRHSARAVHHRSRGSVRERFRVRRGADASMWHRVVSLSRRPPNAGGSARTTHVPLVAKACRENGRRPEHSRQRMRRRRMARSRRRRCSRCRVLNLCAFAGDWCFVESDWRFVGVGP